MPQYGQSPWEQLGNDVTGLGNSMMNVAMSQRMASQREAQFMMQQALREAQLRLEREKFGLQREETGARIADLSAVTRNRQQDYEQQADIGRAADAYSQAIFRRNMPQPGMMPIRAPGLSVDVPMYGGSAAGGFDLASALASRGRIQALRGVFPPMHNITAGSMAVDPELNTRTMGPPATSSGMTPDERMELERFRADQAFRRAMAQAAVSGMLSSGSTALPEDIDAAMGMANQIYSGGRGAGPSPAAGTRIRVRGPNGETGTIPQGASLPRGWQIIQ